MKQRRGLIILVWAMLCGLCACTHNNGDIGPLFGQWRIVGGLPTPAGEALYMSFQNSTVELKAVGDRHESLTAFGNWAQNESTLTLTFPDADRQPPAAFGFSSEMEFHVEKLTTKKLVLIEKSASGRRLELEKW